MDAETIAGTVGGYLGAAVITGLLTRLTIRWFRTKVDRDTAGMVAFLLVSLVVILLVSVAATFRAPTIGVAFSQGFRTFVTIYLPCLIAWLAFDLYKARQRR